MTILIGLLLGIVIGVALADIAYTLGSRPPKGRRE